MANTKQARKRARQAIKRRSDNFSRRSEMRTYIKGTKKAITEGNNKLAEELFQKAKSLCDKLSQKGIIHKNKGARLKSRLSKQVKEFICSSK